MASPILKGLLALGSGVAKGYMAKKEFDQKAEEARALRQMTVDAQKMDIARKSEADQARENWYNQRLEQLGAGLEETKRLHNIQDENAGERLRAEMNHWGALLSAQYAGMAAANQRAAGVQTGQTDRLRMQQEFRLQHPDLFSRGGAASEKIVNPVAKLWFNGLQRDIRAPGAVGYQALQIADPTFWDTVWADAERNGIHPVYDQEAFEADIVKPALDAYIASHKPQSPGVPLSAQPSLNPFIRSMTGAPSR